MWKCVDREDSREENEERDDIFYLLESVLVLCRERALVWWTLIWGFIIQTIFSIVSGVSYLYKKISTEHYYDDN